MGEHSHSYTSHDCIPIWGRLADQEISKKKPGKQLVYTACNQWGLAASKNLQSAAANETGARSTCPLKSYIDYTSLRGTVSFERVPKNLCSVSAPIIVDTERMRENTHS